MTETSTRDDVHAGPERALWKEKRQRERTAVRPVTGAPPRRVQIVGRTRRNAYHGSHALRIAANLSVNSHARAPEPCFDRSEADVRILRARHFRERVLVVLNGALQIVLILREPGQQKVRNIHDEWIGRPIAGQFVFWLRVAVPPKRIQRVRVMQVRLECVRGFLEHAPVGFFRGTPHARVRQQIEAAAVRMPDRRHRRVRIGHGRTDPDGVEFQDEASPEEQVLVLGSSFKPSSTSVVAF